MTTIDPAIHVGDHSRAVGRTARPAPASRPFMIGGIIIVAVLGMISGMAYSNSLFFPLAFLTLVTWAFAGAVLGALGGGAVGFAVDGLVSRQRHR
jgi:hypothetical protein